MEDEVYICDNMFNFTVWAVYVLSRHFHDDWLGIIHTDKLENKIRIACAHGTEKPRSIWLVNKSVADPGQSRQFEFPFFCNPDPFPIL